MLDSAKNKYIIFLLGFTGQWVLYKDPTIWLDEARPPPRYISKHIKIKIAESYISEIRFGDKTSQQ
jgi:hypothetical protein